jgi:RHS repeat-associated protein
VQLPDGGQIEYAADGLGRRVAKYVDGTFVRGYVYKDGLEPIAEIGPAGNLRSVFVYGTRANVPDVMVRDDGTGGRNVYRLISDHLGSVRLVVDVETGAIAQRIDYTVFGKVEIDTNPGFQPFGFAGGLYDHETGLVRFGARDYDPEVGRWTAKDPILFAGGDTNLYGYVLNDPVNSLDSNGFQLAGPESRQRQRTTFGDPDHGARHLAYWVGHSLYGTLAWVVSFHRDYWIGYCDESYVDDPIGQEPPTSIPKDLRDLFGVDLGEDRSSKAYWLGKTMAKAERAAPMTWAKLRDAVIAAIQNITSDP